MGNKNANEAIELSILESKLVSVFNDTNWDMFTSPDTFVPIGIEIKSQLKELIKKVRKEIIK